MEREDILKFKAYDDVQEGFIFSDKIYGGMWRFFKCLEDRGIRHHESLQYTGYKDSEGTEIYKDDVIEFANSKAHGIVKQDYAGAWILEPIEIKSPVSLMYLYVALWGKLKCKVIGNINSNPELIKEVR